MPILPSWVQYKLNTEARSIAREHLKAHARQMRLSFNQIDWPLLYREASELIKREPHYIDWAIISLHSATDRSIQGPDNANPNTQERNTMSPNVGNFVHDLVEMAKAMETLPQVQAQAEHLNNELNTALDHNAALEQNIAGYKNKIEELQSKVRATEAERDDAELRFLELDEKVHTILGLVKGVGAVVGDVVTRLDPPKPQPELVMEAQSQPQVQSEVSFEPNQNAGGSDTTTTAPTGAGSSPAPHSPASQDQGEVNPTAETAHGQSLVVDLATASGEAGGADKPPGPYTGKLYYNHPTYVTAEDWRSGGGNDYSYNWLPSVGSKM